MMENQITINSKTINLPKFTSNILASKRSLDKDNAILLNVGVYWKMVISASWNHDDALEVHLPDHMILSLYPTNKDYHFKIYVNLEEPAMIGSKIVLTTFSKKDGDRWIGAKESYLESLASTQMELSICELQELEWHKPTSNKE